MRSYLKTFRLVLLLLFIAVTSTSCALEASPLQPKGVQGKEQLFLMLLSLAIMILVVIVVYAIAVYVLIRFRARRGDTSIPKQVEGSYKLEMIWTIIPILLLAILAVPTISYSFKHDRDASNDPNALKIKVTGHQYWWEFSYPDLGVHTSQDLVIPVNTTLAFQLTSVDVNHSFWIPAIGGKKDMNAGQVTNFILEATEVGVYKGKCAELCGPSHALMDFKAVVLSDKDFKQWVANMKEPPTVPAELAAGEVLFKANCIQCHAINPDAQSPVAPHLNGFGDRTRIAGILPHDIDNLKAWIRDPQAIKPAANMPGFGEGSATPLNEQQIDDLAKYLLQLK